MPAPQSIIDLVCRFDENRDAYRSGITNDPNNPDDPSYIVRLVKKIVTVSLETVEIVKKLPEQFE